MSDRWKEQVLASGECERILLSPLAVQWHVGSSWTLQRAMSGCANTLFLCPEASLGGSRYTNMEVLFCLRHC